MFDGALGDVDAIQLGHSDIEDEHIRTELLAPSKHLEAVAGFANHLHVRLGFNQRPHATPHDAVIVTQQYSQHAYASVHRTSRPAARPAAWCRRQDAARSSRTHSCS